MSSPSGKNIEVMIELDAVGRQFEPYPYCRIMMRLHAGGALVV